MSRGMRCVRGVISGLLLVAAVSGPALAQRGTLTGTMSGRRMSPTSDTVMLHIDLRMTPGWHVGAVEPGKIGVPTELTWQFPAGWRVVASHWSPPTATVVGRDTVLEYRAPFSISSILVTGQANHSGAIKAVIAYGICREVCIPGRLTLTDEVH